MRRWIAGIGLATVVVLTAQPRVVSGSAVTIDGDLSLGDWSPGRTRWLASIPVCVRPPDDGGSAAAYRIRATGTASAGRFALANDLGDTIPYQTQWFERGPRGRRETLAPGAESRRTYAFAGPSGCGAEDAPHVRVRVDAGAVDRAPPGVYRDTITLAVSPE